MDSGDDGGRKGVRIEKKVRLVETGRTFVSDIISLEQNSLFGFDAAQGLLGHTDVGGYVDRTDARC